MRWRFLWWWNRLGPAVAGLLGYILALGNNVREHSRCIPYRDGISVLLGRRYQLKAKLFIMTGVLGGFTTFSTYLLNFMTLYASEQKLEAILYLAGSVIVGCAFLLLGMELLQHLWG